MSENGPWQGTEPKWQLKRANAARVQTTPVGVAGASYQSAKVERGGLQPGGRGGGEAGSEGGGTSDGENEAS